MSLTSLNWNLNTDRTVNKIAFCSAVVAGFAYVGYSVVRTAFTRRRRFGRNGEEDDADDFGLPKQSVFLRRLSQTTLGTQTDTLLGDFDTSGAMKVILRPKSVQERIRDLNAQARQFADAVTAIQGNGHSTGRMHGVSGRSLQVTPWGSPRILSPVDVRHIVSEQGEQEKYSLSGSPSRQRWSPRASFSRKVSRRVDFDIPSDPRLKESQQLWDEEKDDVLLQLPEVLGCQREINLEEAKVLVAALNSEDVALLIETLSSISNYAAFTVNQDRLRECGLIALLPKLLINNSNRQVKQKICMVVSNMALNDRNHSEMRVLATTLALLAQTTPISDPALLSNTFNALTNLAVLPAWHLDMKCALHKGYGLLDEGHWNIDGVSLLSLRFLINMSCNDEMIPSLLAAQAPARLIYMLDMSMPEEVLLRILTLLSNIFSSAKRLEIDPLRLPAEDKAAAPDTMFAAVCGLSMAERYKNKAMILSRKHANEDVVQRALKLLEALSED